MSEKQYNVGVYIRLSRESGNYIGHESQSIENQQAILSKFIRMMPGWKEKRIYIDNGASGANFNRQGFQKMMDDVRQGIINLVMVKDLSRFGRNYIETGKYLEQELPALGCRFVALSDGIDTETGENDIMPFLNAINDFYLKNLSDRIKSVFTAKAKDGQKLTGVAPYGYDRDSEANTRLVVDKYAAEVVKRIFQKRAEGAGYSLIARMLNKENIMPPRLYYYSRHKRETKAVCSDIWLIRTVKLILCNEIYIGNTVSLKRKLRSYRDRREIKCDESEWIRVLNTHPPIIEKDLWQEVQQINKEAKDRFANSREPQQSLFSGIAECADCHSSMTYVIKTTKHKSGRVVKYGGYNCGTYCNSGGSVCSRHSISERSLKELVHDHIKKVTGLITLNEERILCELKKRLTGIIKAGEADSAKKRRRHEQLLYALESQIEQLYEKKATGVITADTFSALFNDIEAQRIEAESNLNDLTQTVEQTKAKLTDIKMHIGLIKEKSAFDEIDRKLLESLIDKIEIGERVASGGNSSQSIRILGAFQNL